MSDTSNTGTTGTGTSGTGQFVDELMVGAVPTLQSYGQSYSYNPPPRPASDPRFAPVGWSPANRYDQYSYTGGGLVNEKGLVTLFDDGGQPRYYTSEDATQYYFGMPTAQKALILETMSRKGYSVGSPDRDQNAIWDLMQMSNMMGRTIDVTLSQLDRIAGDVSQKVAAPRYRVSSSADIRTVANQVAQRTLGREFTSDESQRFVESYQQAELGYQQATAGVVESTPAVDVAAQQFAQEVAPTEANAYKYLGAVDMLMKNLGAV